MKNRAVQAVAALTIFFVGITVGFSLGRQVTKTPIHISVMETTAPPTATLPALTMPATLPSAPTTASVPTAPTQPGLINLNTATAEQLCELPGIGPVLAKRIVEYRTRNGAFGSPEDLTKVDGIGTKRLEAILDYVTIGG